MSVTKENAGFILGLLRSMTTATEKAQRGSDCEDGYFLEKLDKLNDIFNLIGVQKRHER